jgi:flagellar motility protein MotE (MotC chaperone)
MCGKCDEIDKTIERYRGIKERVSDEALVARAKELIAELEADKAAIHSEIRQCGSCRITEVASVGGLIDSMTPPRGGNP